MPNWGDIPRYISHGGYGVDVEFKDVESWLGRQQEHGHKIEIDPDFQRGHVWSEQQQIAFVEHIAMGGRGASDLMWNHPSYTNNEETRCNLPTDTLILVDGKQRLTAVRRFMANEIPAFGHLLREYDGHMRLHCRLRMNVNNLQTRRELLQYYIQFNAGGVVHSDEEIERVRALLKAEEGR
jgi:hypothetical protein